MNRLQWTDYVHTAPVDSNNPIHQSSASFYSYETSGDKMRVKQIITQGMLPEDFLYDVEGRVSEHKQTVEYRYSHPMTVNYLYDTLDRVKEVTYPAQYGLAGNPRKIVAHTFDTSSRLTAMTYDGTQQAGNIVYNAADQTTQMKVGPTGTNQVTEDYTFDAQTGLLNRQTAKKNGGATTLIDLSYDYARNNSVGSLNGKTGHLTKITDKFKQ